MIRKIEWGFLVLALMALLSAPAVLADEAAISSCPWVISKVQAGKWGNGNQKAGLWFKGSFPINIPGVTERPTWYVNGVDCGKSQIHFSLRFLPNSSAHLKDGQSNTVTVKFLKPPYNGASNSRTFTFSWSQVPNGGYKEF